MTEQLNAPLWTLDSKAHSQNQLPLTGCVSRELFPVWRELSRRDLFFVLGELNTTTAKMKCSLSGDLMASLVSMAEARRL